MSVKEKYFKFFLFFVFAFFFFLFFTLNIPGAKASGHQTGEWFNYFVCGSGDNWETCQEHFSPVDILDFQVWRGDFQIFYYGEEHSSMAIDICFGQSQLMWGFDDECTTILQYGGPYMVHFERSKQLGNLTKTKDYNYLNEHIRIKNATVHTYNNVYDRRVSIDSFSSSATTVNVGDTFTINWVTDWVVVPESKVVLSWSGAMGDDSEMFDLCPPSFTNCPGSRTFTAENAGTATFNLSAAGPGTWGRTTVYTDDSSPYGGSSWPQSYGNITEPPAITVNISIPPTEPPRPPPGPFTLTAPSGCVEGVIHLDWAASQNAASYRIFSRAGTEGDWNQIAEVDSSTFSYDDSVASDIDWYYYVKAVNQYGTHNSNTGSPDEIVALFGGNCPSAPSEVDCAEFVSQDNVPTAMFSGSSTQVSIKMHNCGNTTWTEDPNVCRLGSQNPQDNRYWVSTARAFLPSPVPPGEDATFAFTITAPLELGTYNFQWRMVREGAWWFGDFTPNVPIDVVSSKPVVSNVVITQPDYCHSGPAAIVNWTYSDPAQSPQLAYQVQIDEQASFQNPEVDSGKIYCEGCRSYSTLQGILQFNTTYRARVRAWNQSDIVSDWVVSNSWKTPPYAYPQVNFIFAPANPGVIQLLPNEPIQFTDQTVFYDDNPQGHRWSWLFGDGGSSTQRNPKHTYTQANIFNATLTATDNADQSCSITKPVNIQLPNPIWKEVNPGG